MAPEVDLVHLVWVPLGLAPFERFVAAHLAHPLALPARLVVVYSGHTAEGQLEPYRAHLKGHGLAHREIRLPGPGWDLGAYRSAAAQLGGEWVCFVNSWSRPLAAGWLECLVAPQLRDRRLRLIGAGGNLASAFWHLPPEATQGFSRIPGRGWTQRWRWRRVVDYQLRAFPPGPGPVVRTNAFALRRLDFLRLRFPPFRTKRDTYEFESGWVSMTRQILGCGYTVAVAGRGRGSPALGVAGEWHVLLPGPRKPSRGRQQDRPL